MTVLFVNRFCYPDLAGTGKTLTELATQLVNLGFNVTVLAGDTAAYDSSQRYSPRESMGGVEVHRVKAARFDQKTIWGWTLNALLFYPAVLLGLLRLPRHDVTIFLTDPPLIFILGPMMRFVKSTKFVCWSQDLYPDVAVELGVLGKRSLMTSFWSWLARWALKRADLVIAIGEIMAERLKSKGVSPGRIVVSHNWADGKMIFPVPETSNRFLSENGLEGKFVVAYSGNMGLSHEFATILEGAKRLMQDTDVVFLFIGEGKAYERVKREAEAINAVFLPFQPESRLAESLSAADVHVVTLKPGLEGLLVPKKLYGAMAVGRPIIYLGPERSEAAQVIARAGCGVTIAPGDADLFAAAVIRYRDDKILTDKEGRQGQTAFEKEYELRHGAKRIAEAIAAV